MRRRIHTDGSFSNVCVFKLDHTRATRAAIGLVLNLGTVDLSDRREQINEILVAGGPRQLV